MAMTQTLIQIVELQILNSLTVLVDCTLKQRLKR